MKKVFQRLILPAAAMAAAGAWFWHQGTVRSSAVSQPAPQVQAETLPLHPVVKRVVEEGPTMPYLKFNYLIKEIPTNLAAQDIGALVAMISGPQPAVFGDGEWGSLVNDMEEALTVQSEPSPRVAEALIAIHRDEARGQMQRDYALQHIGGFAIYLVHTRETRQGVLPAFFPDLVGELKAAVADPMQPWAGTAINLLDGVLRAAEYRGVELTELDAGELMSLARPVIAREEAPLNARIPALQLATRRDFPSALEEARNILADPEANLMLAQTAAAVVGARGDKTDLPLLETLQSRRRPHLQAALREAADRLRNL